MNILYGDFTRTYAETKTGDCVFHHLLGRVAAAAAGLCADQGSRGQGRGWPPVVHLVRLHHGCVQVLDLT